jgi:hypothetical protein
MRTLTLLASAGAIVAIGGCASSSGSATTSEGLQRTILTDDRTYQTTVAPNSRFNLAAPPERVWAVLADVYSDFKVEVKTLDRATWRMGNPNIIVMRQFAGEAMSAWVSCGDGFTGPRANNERIYLSILSTIHPNPKGGSDLEVGVSAGAQKVDGTSADRTACGSTGRLEARIHRAVANKLGVPANSQ